jgi:uncharacterized protein YggT (Ycf19 family)
MEPDKVAVAEDEARRIAQHERIKSKLEGDVHQSIARESNAAGSPADQAEIRSVAADLRHKATNEVAQTERELGRARGVTRSSQVIDYLFYLAYGLISVEIVLELFGARESSGFKSFIDALSMPLLAPFRGLFRDPSVGSMQLMFSYIAALVVYILLHLAVNGLLRIFTERKSRV